MKISLKNDAYSVAVPAIFLWAAGQKARFDCNVEDINKIQMLFKHTNAVRRKHDKKSSIRESKFNVAVKHLLNKGIIPFVRDDFDLSLASTLFSEISGFRVRSERSFVDSGFLRVREKDIEYIDSVAGITRDDAKYPDLLEHNEKAIILNFLDALASKNFRYQTANDDSEILKVLGDFTAFASITDSLDCNISLWHDPLTQSKNNKVNSNRLARRLGSATILATDGYSLRLTGVLAQSKLEMAAGSLMDQWLLIESDQLKIFGKLPDLTLEGDLCPALVDPVSALDKFTLGVSPTAYIDQDSAAYFSKAYPWFVPKDPDTWLKGIA